MILELEFSDEERARILNHWFMQQQPRYRVIAAILASNAERVRVTVEDIARIRDVLGSYESEARAAAQTARNQAWEERTGRTLGEGMFIDQDGDLHDPVGYHLRQAWAELLP